MDNVNRSLEDNLEDLRGPSMPEEVESRVRRRLQSEMLAKPADRMLRRASAWQLALLLSLLAAAGWVFRSQVAPVLRDAWERAHCLIDPSAKKP
jgi:hypothetical protein